jgi:CDP-diacylglycerol--glycerol-3-phosphate 3-phosphatidyltransferase
VNVATVLTLIRLISSPFILPVLFVYLLPVNVLFINLILAFLFLLIGSTDFFDGYIARRYHQETYLGKILDPIADKFLIYSMLIILVGLRKLYFYWAIAFIGREFFVMALREIALSQGFSLVVLPQAKLKTALQIVSLAWVIVNPYQALGFSCILWNGTELMLLSSALFFSVASAVQYYKIFMKKVRLS